MWRPLSVSGTIQSSARRPPALPPLPPAGPGSGLPLRNPPILGARRPRGERQPRRRRQTLGGSARTHAAGAVGSRHQASHLFPAGKLPGILLSGSSSTQNNPRHSQRQRIQAGESLGKEVEERNSPALTQSLVSAFPGPPLINNTPQLQRFTRAPTASVLRGGGGGGGVLVYFISFPCLTLPPTRLETSLCRSSPPHPTPGCGAPPPPRPHRNGRGRLSPRRRAGRYRAEERSPCSTAPGHNRV
uniref:Uncharacterized protein n=1 Tax=Gallus gallus TaxID=9031 RepID=A0A8V0YTM3_CHICK